MAVLEELTSLDSAPALIRSDNGNKFIAQVLLRWCKDSGTRTGDIEPGSAWQNGYAETHELRSTSSSTTGANRCRDEFRNTELITHSDWAGPMKGVTSKVTTGTF